VTRYLLDTNIVSDLVRNVGGRAAARLAAIGGADVCTSIIVAAELRFGILRRGSPRLSAQVEAFLQSVEVLPFAPPEDFAYARIRFALERAGTIIGGNDLLLAAQAVAQGLTLVTDNEREISRVAGLKWENWLR
jgi:tRNA(fMet)-specific endonuclease VapC